MIELYLIIGLLLATGSIVVCDKVKDKKMYALIFIIITLLWPVIAIVALSK